MNEEPEKREAHESDPMLEQEQPKVTTEPTVTAETLPEQSASFSGNSWLIIGVGVIVIVGGAFGMYWLKKQEVSDQVPTPSPPAASVPESPEVTDDLINQAQLYSVRAVNLIGAQDDDLYLWVRMVGFGIPHADPTKKTEQSRDYVLVYNTKTKTIDERELSVSSEERNKYEEFIGTDEATIALRKPDRYTFQEVTLTSGAITDIRSTEQPDNYHIAKSGERIFIDTEGVTTDSTTGRVSYQTTISIESSEGEKIYEYTLPISREYQLFIIEDYDPVTSKLYITEVTGEMAATEEFVEYDTTSNKRNVLTTFYRSDEDPLINIAYSSDKSQYAGIRSMYETVDGEITRAYNKEQDKTCIENPDLLDGKGDQVVVRGMTTGAESVVFTNLDTPFDPCAPWKRGIYGVAWIDNETLIVTTPQGAYLVDDTTGEQEEIFSEETARGVGYTNEIQLGEGGWVLLRNGNLVNTDLQELHSLKEAIVRWAYYPN